MASFEIELKRLEKNILRLSNLALFPKAIDIRGSGNFIRTGPNIIVGNHIGSYKDVGLLFKIVPRPIFFTANKMIFNEGEFSLLVRRHLHRHLKDFGLFIHLILNPFYALVVDYISSHIANIGTIPVDLDLGRAAAVRKCQAYLKQGRAVIALQGRGRVDPDDPNPYIKPFRKGAAVMAFNLFKQDRISVPVTPLAMFGTHIAFPVPGTIKVGVGEPMYVKDYAREDDTGTIEAFRDAIQNRVADLFMGLIRR